MKKTTEILLIILTLITALSAPFSSYAATSKSIYTSSKYTHNSKFDKCEITHGIDISYHNGTINWTKLKQSETEYVIIRVGYRGYGKKGNVLKDTNFDSYMKSAKEKGFHIGVYFYSQALTTSEAKEEANFVLKNIKNYKLDLPVFFDYEFAGVSDGRLDSAWHNKTLNKDKMTKNALAFCETIEDAGYRAGIYASKYFYLDNLDRTQLEDKYSIWLAHYATKTDYTGEYQMWQYSSKGKVSGIEGYVDGNFMYSTMLSIMNTKVEISDISNKTYTGNEIEPDFTVTVNGKKLVKDEDYLVTFSNNVKIGTATAIVTGINDYEGTLKATKSFSIVPEKVQNLKFESRGTKSLKVSWTKNNNANGYYVQVHRSAGWIKAGTTTKTSFSITDLATASNYKIRVRAYKTVDSVKYYSSYCPEIETATLPSTPTSLSASSIKPTSLKLKWKKQSNASYYEVYKYNSKSKKYVLYKKINGGKNNSLTINNLTADTKYKFKVKAYKNAKDGKLLKSDKSAAFSVYTVPKSPTIKSAKSSKKKRITVKWKKVSGVSGYKVMWSTTKGFTSNYKSVFSTGSSKTLTTAKSKKTYYVRVRSYKVRNGKKIYSPWSKTLKVKTK